LVSQPVDKSILQEIVRVVDARRRVPDRVQVRTKEYLITYLDDHQNRLEEALRRFDSDKLNMLYGQLASKVKYKAHRTVSARKTPPAKKAPVAKKSVAKKPPAAKKSVAKKLPAAKKKVAKKKPHK
jgi:hypothetical protein